MCIVSNLLNEHAHNDYSTTSRKDAPAPGGVAFRRSNCITNALAPQDGAAGVVRAPGQPVRARGGMRKPAAEWQPRVNNQQLLPLLRQVGWADGCV